MTANEFSSHRSRGRANCHKKYSKISVMKAKKNLAVVGDRVLIEPDEKGDRTSTGLYLPPTVKKRQSTGRVCYKNWPGLSCP